MTDFWTNFAWLIALLLGFGLIVWRAAGKVVAEIRRAGSHRIPTEVAVLAYGNSNGDEIYVYATEEQAYAGLAEIVRANWASAAGEESYWVPGAGQEGHTGTVPDEPPAGDERAIALYFDALTDAGEWYSVKVEKVWDDRPVVPGPYATMTVAEVECALATLAEMHSQVEPGDLSKRQIEVLGKVCALWSRSLGDADD